MKSEMKNEEYWKKNRISRKKIYIIELNNFVLSVADKSHLKQQTTKPNSSCEKNEANFFKNMVFPHNQVLILQKG